MPSNAQISPEVVCRYAADAALEVPGVARVVEGHLPARSRGVRVSMEEGRARVELHLSVEWGASIPEAARAVQARVRSYLESMVDLELAEVDVVIDEILASPMTQ